MRILIIDDEEIHRVSLADYLNRTGEYEAAECPAADEALKHIVSESYDIALVDYKMPGMNGLDFLAYSREQFPEMDIVIMTAYGTVDLAVDAMKRGALDFLQKPFSTGELKVKLERWARHKKLVRENILLRQELEERFGFQNLIGRSEPMRELFTRARSFSESDYPILIIGESGTGKGQIARALHFSGLRRDKPFVEIHCGSLSGSILESELFGHAKGAFTGAVRDREGKLEAARDGTVYLDDIDSMPLDLQAKLLRVLQENEFERVGSNKTIHLKARTLASVKPDIRSKVDAGQFRQDLYYRLNVLNLPIPPLRHHLDDVPLLIDHFIKMKKEKIHSAVEAFSPEAINLLSKYTFPGNVRELEHIVERVMHLCREKEVKLQYLPPEINSSDSLDLSICLKQMEGTDFSLPDLILSVEKQFYERALVLAGGNQSRAARFLGLPKSTFQEKARRCFPDLSIDSKN